MQESVTSKILIVDDDSVVAKSLKLCLEKSGYEVVANNDLQQMEVSLAS